MPDLSTQFQSIRRGEELWEVTKVTELWEGTFEYEIVGRVLRDGDLYYVELPLWKETSYEWLRETRGFQVPRGAIRFITEGGTKRVVQ